MSSFRFKQFEVNHEKSSIKVGVDGVLIGAWAVNCLAEKINEINKVLDVGCGCGLIALILAQGLPNADIDAVDIHKDSISEAFMNFKNSPWGARLRAMQCDIADYAEDDGRYDIVVSNPPFFNSGIKEKSTPREKARHQDTLSPRSLISYSTRLLRTNGSLFFIAPYDQLLEIERELDLNCLKLKKVCYVKGSHASRIKRIMIEAAKIDRGDVLDRPEFENLVIRDENGDYSMQYKELTKAYYINF